MLRLFQFSIGLAFITTLANGAPSQPAQLPLGVGGNTFLGSSIFGQHYIEANAQSNFYIDNTFQGYEPYAGIATFAHLNWTNCFSPESDNLFDIGIVGAPFDLGVTYRPGERFGPAGTRMGSRRLSPSMGYR